MRKVIVGLAGICAVLAASVGIASASGGGAHSAQAGVTCDTLYTPPCGPPSAVVVSKASCQKTGKTLHFPIRLHAPAGLRKVLVTFRGKKIKTVTYQGKPETKTLSVTISTRGFKPALFTLTVKVTDVKGRTATRHAHFTICKPKPVFTG
jgi:hypothetical protein